jgi:class 3 adenylate cyclase/tetratricopeptide (TPR) repeat protein
MAAQPRLEAFLYAELAEGSDTLARLGEARADEARRTSSRILRETVAAAGGREVRPVPDGLLAAFATSSDAITSAVALRRACDRHNAHASDPLHLRVGIHVGETAAEGVGDGEAAPGPALQARALCRAATGGQILVSGVAHALAASRISTPFERAGLLKLPGVPEPVPSFEVRCERAPALRLPLPPEAADGAARRTDFVGRGSELQRLRAIWDAAASGERRVAFVSGEPGIGKTRLAAELAREAHSRGGAVLWGRCFEEALVPYQPFVQALRHVVAHEDPHELRLQLGRHAGPLTRFVPEIASALAYSPPEGPDDPESERYRLFLGVSSFVSELAATAPVLLVLDDLQWADRATLLLLEHLARDPTPAPVLVLATYRDTEVGPAHPLTQARADIARDRFVERIDLQGLVEEEVGALVGSLVGWAPPSELARRLQSGTAGNPFFLQEVAGNLEELRLVSAADRPPATKVTVDRLAVSSRVRELVARRIQRLSGAAHDALSTASVAGTEFDLDVLAAVLGVSSDDLIEAMDEAVSARLLVETDRLGRYGFAHTLIQQALYDAQTVNRRASLHYRVGQAIEELHAEDPSAYLAGIAHHYGAAGPRAADKVLRYCPPAGERALELVAYEDAVHYFSSALAAHATLRPGDEPARADLLVRLGTAQTRAGDAEAARASFREAAEVAKRNGEGDTLARAALGYGGGAGFGGVWITFGGVDDVLIELLEDALPTCPEDGPLRVRLLGRLAQALYWQPGRARSRDLSEEALASARRLGDPEAVAYALDSRHVALWGPNDLDERRRVAEEMLALGEELDDCDIRLEAYAWLITDVLEEGDLDAVDRYIEAHARAAEELRQPYHLWYTQVVRAMRAYMDGRYADTERLAAEALAYGRHAHAENAQQTYNAQLLFLMRELGRLDESVAMLEEYVAASPLSNWHVALALTYAELDRPEDALAQIEDFAAERFDGVPRDCLWTATLAILAQVVGKLDATEHAAPLLELLEPFAERTCVVAGAIFCFGPISRLLGTLARVAGDPERACRYLDDALARSRELASPPLVARTQLETAKALLARGRPGDDDEAARRVAEAAEIARTLGMATVGRDIVAVRERLGRGVAVA